MRIWDIHPGFLNDKSLLGEHRELHGIFSILTTGKKGYSRHPETLRWQGCLSGLSLRHELLVQEMRLRGFQHRSPLTSPASDTAVTWPEIFIDLPGRQFEILAHKYQVKSGGRIPLPKNSQELWAQHKYSIMARDYRTYRRIGSLVAQKSFSVDTLAQELVTQLRTPPPEKSLRNALLHMWGYISNFSELFPESLRSQELLHEIQKQAKAHHCTYILNATALSEMAS